MANVDLSVEVDGIKFKNPVVVEASDLNLDSLRNESLSLHTRNLEEASFEERVDLIYRLGVKVVPSEDLETRYISCRLKLDNSLKKGAENGLTKVMFGGPFGTVPELLFEKKGLIPNLQRLLTE
ncbi:MAG: hypothetical protein HY530_06395 [Chloroflexi bacterium]|nr:hypothetical protein [Chloroflexota bacterium]